MSPTPEEIELGEKAYRWVQSYEKNGGQSFRPQILVAVIVAGLLLLAFFLSDTHAHQRMHEKASMLIPFLPVFVIVMLVKFWAARKSYANHKLLLQLLKEKYGETLPWLVEEKQLASARALEAEIASARLANQA